MKLNLGKLSPDMTEPPADQASFEAIGGWIVINDATGIGGSDFAPTLVVIPKTTDLLGREPLDQPRRVDTPESVMPR